jgi:hypothetical protein
MNIFELEKVVIIIVSLAMAYAEFRQAVLLKGSWIKVGLGFMGLYWAAYYAYALYRDYYNIRLPIHQVFVRSGILLTVTLVAIGAFRTLDLLRRKK